MTVQAGRIGADLAGFQFTVKNPDFRWHRKWRISHSMRAKHCGWLGSFNYIARLYLFYTIHLLLVSWRPGECVVADVGSLIIWLIFAL